MKGKVEGRQRPNENSCNIYEIFKNGRNSRGDGLI